MDDHEERLCSLRKYRSEYEDLRSTLGKLPQRTRHEIMVPLNSVAFMPGQLDHTNEVTALLGDNYFAERSASQAQDILTRRIEAVDKLIEDQEAQVDALLDKKFTAERLRDQLASLGRKAPDGTGNAKSGGRLEEVDIHEAYDDPPAPAPAPNRHAAAAREPDPESDPEPSATATPKRPASTVDPMYGLSASEYADLLSDMEREELVSACDDFGLRLHVDSSKPAPTDKALRQLLRRHLLGGDASRRSYPTTKAKASPKGGLRGGFFDKPHKKAAAARQKSTTRSDATVPPQPEPEQQLGDASPTIGGVVERFDKNAGRWIKSSEGSGTTSGSDRIADAATAAATTAPAAAEAAAAAAAAAPRRVSKFKLAREQAKVQARANHPSEHR